MKFDEFSLFKNMNIYAIILHLERVEKKKKKIINIIKFMM